MAVALAVVSTAVAAVPLVESVVVKFFSVLVNGVEKYYEERVRQRQMMHEKCMERYQPFRRYAESGSMPVQDLSQLAFAVTGISLAQQPYTADEQSSIENRLSMEGAAGVKAHRPCLLDQVAVCIFNGTDVVLVVTCEQIPEYHQRLYKSSTLALPDVLPSVCTLKMCGYDHLDNLHVCHFQVIRQSTFVNLSISMVDNHLMIR